MGWRDTKEYTDFRNAVIARDGVCQCCGSNEHLHAHHTFHAKYYPQYRFDVDKGLTLCEGCHRLLHYSIVGNSNKSCTPKDTINLYEARDYFKG